MLLIKFFFVLYFAIMFYIVTFLHYASADITVHDNITVLNKVKDIFKSLKRERKFNQTRSIGGAFTLIMLRTPLKGVQTGNKINRFPNK